MTKWATASDLADMKLKGLPTSKRGVNKLASKNGWATRKRIGKGGGVEYKIESISPAVKNEILRREAIVNGMAKSPRNNTVQQIKTIGAKEEADARIWLINQAEKYRVEHSSILKAFTVFSEEFNTGKIETPDYVLEHVTSVSAPTLKRWVAKLKKGGINALSDQYVGQTGNGAIEKNADLHDFIRGMLIEFPNTSNRNVMRALRARFERDIIPCYRTVCRFAVKFKKENKKDLMALNHPDAWRNKYQVAAGSQSEGITRLNQVWELDSTPTDMLLDGGCRHSIVGLVDVYSRRAMFLVSRTSKASAVVALLRRAMMEWGVPEVIKTDNGQDYVSKHISRVVTSLNIEQKICPPFTPEGKPHVERVFKTFQHQIVELLDGYVGHNVTDRQAIENKKAFSQRLGEETIKASVTPEELQEICDNWCKADYERQVHGSLKVTPFEKATSYAGAITKIENERALDILLSEAPEGGQRRVGKKGIRLNTLNYNAPELALHVGDDVLVMFDDADAGQVYCFDMNHEFICMAEAYELSGVSRQEIAAKSTAIQREQKAESRRALKKLVKDTNVADIAQEIRLDNAIKANKLVEFPRQAETYTTPALEAAEDALGYDSLDADQPSNHSTVNVEPMPESAASKTKRCVDIIEKIRDGEEVESEDRIFALRYSQTSEYLAEVDFNKDFENPTSNKLKEA